MMIYKIRMRDGRYLEVDATDIDNACSTLGVDKSAVKRWMPVAKPIPMSEATKARLKTLSQQRRSLRRKRK